MSGPSVAGIDIRVVYDRDQLSATVRAAQRGDEDAFAEIVARFQDIAVAYATSILHDYHLAEDAAQEAFLDAYRGAVWDIPIELGPTLTYKEIVATGLVRPIKILAYYNDLATARPLLERVAEHFRLRRMLTWDRPPPAEQVARLRRGIRDRLANAGRPASDSETLDLDDARHLIARSEGCEDWAALVASVR